MTVVTTLKGNAPASGGTGHVLVDWALMGYNADVFAPYMQRRPGDFALQKRADDEAEWSRRRARLRAWLFLLAMLCIALVIGSLAALLRLFAPGTGGYLLPAAGGNATRGGHNSTAPQSAGACGLCVLPCPMSAPRLLPSPRRRRSGVPVLLATACGPCADEPLKCLSLCPRPADVLMLMRQDERRRRRGGPASSCSQSCGGGGVFAWSSSAGAYGLPADCDSASRIGGSVCGRCGGAALVFVRPLLCAGDALEISRFDGDVCDGLR